VAVNRAQSKAEVSNDGSFWQILLQKSVAAVVEQ
jgi:hypothetical protein